MDSRPIDHSKAVSVRGLERRFGAFVAVNRIDFDVEKGRIFGFLGPNGAGKSTTIRMLCGILSPTGGQGVVAGMDIVGQSESIKEKIGYMSQRFSLYEDLTVEENIDFFSGIYRVSHSLKSGRKDWVLEMAGLTEHRNRMTATLSGGWKQRLALGCAILHEPPILFLDEPTSGVDPISRRQFWDLIHGMSETGVTIFVTTHYMDEAEYCDDLALIYGGDIIAQGAPEELKNQNMHEFVFDVRCERPQDALACLHERGEVHDSALFGNGLHVLMRHEAGAVELLERTLRDAGFAPQSIERIVPSLEDVFVSLVEERQRQARAIVEDKS